MSEQSPKSPPPEPGEGSSSRPPVNPTGPGAPPPAPAGYAAAPAYASPGPRRISGLVTGVLGALLAAVLIGSIVLNFYFAAVVGAFTGGLHETTWQKGDSAQRIVVLPIEGLIDASTARFVHRALRKLRRDPPKALILRVESGGGAVTAADQIREQLRRFEHNHQHIPLIASFGGVAASGGYYVAADADAIVAEPTTITGSIGVIAPGFTFKDLLDKVGVTPEIITSTQSTQKANLYPFHHWTDEDRAELRGLLDHMYQRFVKVVYEGRSRATNITKQQVRDLATGKAYIAAKAKKLKLIDREGYLEDAVALAAKKAGIPPKVRPQVSRLGPAQGFGLLNLLGKDHTPPISKLNGEQLRKRLLKLSSPKLLYYAHLR